MADMQLTKNNITEWTDDRRELRKLGMHSVTQTAFQKII